MSKKIIKAIILTILLLITIIYTYYIRVIVDDELFNYGFSINIINGLVPYKDFNMIIPPIFPYILAIFIYLFGKHLIIYHLFISLIIVTITYIAYLKIGMYTIVIYLLLLVYPYTGYNMFSLLLLFILLNTKDNYIKSPLIISLMFLTKQTLGLLIIPCLIYSKNKIKTLITFLIPITIFLIYLIINNNLYQFIDYCFLGMLDFTSSNNTGINILLILELSIILILIINICKSKFKKNSLLYILLFQIIVFPIVDLVHFIIGFIPCVYIFLNYIKKYKYLLGSTIIMALFIIGIITYDNLYVSHDIKSLHHYEVNNFMYKRMTPIATKEYIEEINNYLDKYSDYDSYILGSLSYIVKLNLNIDINKYDIINNGNMGYNGSVVYINEIDNNCKNNKCLFFIRENELITKSQTNKEILKYIINNYYKIRAGNIYSVYITNRHK